MNLLEYSQKVVQAELTWISRHTGGNPTQGRRVLLRLRWLIRNLVYRGIRRNVFAKSPVLSMPGVRCRPEVRERLQ